MALNAESKDSNLRLSFNKALYTGLSAANRLLVNFGQERLDESARGVWAEVDMLHGAGGQGEHPWTMQVSIYSHPSEDEFGHEMYALVDAIRAALSSTSKYLIYEFGTTDITRATPVTTGLYFFPIVAPDETAPTFDRRVDGRILRIRCFNWRNDMQGR